MQRHFSQLRMFKTKYLQDFFCCFVCLFVLLLLLWIILLKLLGVSACTNELEGKALLCSRFFISTASETNWLIAISLINITNASLTLNGFCRLWLIEFVSFYLNQIFQRKVMVNSKFFESISILNMLCKFPWADVHVLHEIFFAQVGWVFGFFCFFFL